MKGAGVKLIAVLLASLALAGCSSTGDSKDSSQAASIEDRSGGASSSAMDDEAAARARALEEERRLRGSDLNDPDGPLSVRVIYFDYDSNDIRAEFERTVSAHAQYLAANPSVSVTLEGHADERGSPEYNLALGERRALSVRRQLVLLGASANQVRTVSYGEERPAVDGHDEGSYALNRRVELVY